MLKAVQLAPSDGVVTRLAEDLEVYVTRTMTSTYESHPELRDDYMLFQQHQQFQFVLHQEEAEKRCVTLSTQKSGVASEWEHN